MIPASRKKSWSVWQVHNAVAADIKTSSLCMVDKDQQKNETVHNQQITRSNILQIVGTTGQEEDAYSTVSQSPHEVQLPAPPLFRVLLPALIPGTRIYTDAAMAPDSLPQATRKAGLGIFIVNAHQPNQSAVYIKAISPQTTSVLMAEAAALMLAADIASALQIRQPTFLSDNQQLMTFFYRSENSNPPC